ncbi:MAG: twin-arginine translocase TatA/TatE family subunit [Thiotrichales bacterium]|nr:twin-arginine translocase TatA/TatE family subunit [Thiotrichales bacterium]
MGISIWQLLIILAIVLVLFGAKRLRNVGSDLGATIKGFKNAMSDEEKKAEEAAQAQNNANPSAQTTQALEANKVEGNAAPSNNVFTVAAEEKKTEEKKDKV